MKIAPASRAALFTTALSLASWKTGWAQGITPQTPAPSSQSGTMTTVVVVISVIAVLVVLGLLIKLLDLKRKRDGEAIVVQARISDAILRDPRLFNLAITPTAHVPLWTGSPVTVELTGHVPSDDLRRAAVEMVEREAAQLGSDVRIESKITTEPAMARQSA